MESEDASFIAARLPMLKELQDKLHEVGAWGEAGIIEGLRSVIAEWLMSEFVPGKPEHDAIKEHLLD